MKNIYSSGLLLAVILVVAAGCATHDWKKERRDTAGDYQRDLQKETRELLAHYRDGLDLSNCVAIARLRSTRLIGSQLATKMAQIDRDASFSAFLPQVNATFDVTKLSQPAAKEFDNQGAEGEHVSTAHQLAIGILELKLGGNRANAKNALFDARGK